jgi:hypothetical protein
MVAYLLPLPLLLQRLQLLLDLGGGARGRLLMVS